MVGINYMDILKQKEYIAWGQYKKEETSTTKLHANITRDIYSSKIRMNVNSADVNRRYNIFFIYIRGEILFDIFVQYNV